MKGKQRNKIIAFSELSVRCLKEFKFNFLFKTFTL